VRVYNPARRGPGRASERWRKWKEQNDLTEYEARWQQMEADGRRIHAEADFVERFLAGSGSKRVLDAGCGTGRVGVELASRGHDVVGVDNDSDMLEWARPKSDDVTWMLADLSSVRFDRPFDAIVMAGSVLVYAEPPRRHLIVPNLATALVNGGYLITGTEFAPAFDLEGYDLWCRGANLHLVERYASWDGDKFVEGGDYAVSVHAAYDT
jgi:SAM-dependent methyltransferase